MYPAPPVTRTVMMLARLPRKYRAAGKFQVSGTVCYGPETKRRAAPIGSAPLGRAIRASSECKQVVHVYNGLRLRRTRS
jgi:hypothetical protein